MPDLEADSTEVSLSEVAARATEAAAALHATLRELTERAGKNGADRPYGEGLRHMFQDVYRQHQDAEATFAELAEAVEDALDIADAEAALVEPGASIPWKQVKAELGLQ